MASVRRQSSEQLLLARVFDFTLDFVADGLGDAAGDFELRRLRAAVEGRFEGDAEFAVFVLRVFGFAPMRAHQLADVGESFLLFEVLNVSGHSSLAISRMGWRSRLSAARLWASASASQPVALSRAKNATMRFT